VVLSHFCLFYTRFKLPSRVLRRLYTSAISCGFTAFQTAFSRPAASVHFRDILRFYRISDCLHASLRRLRTATISRMMQAEAASRIR
jgi:hypothetical protein